MSYPTYLNYIQANEKVSSAVANRTAAELDRRTDHLKEQLDSAEIGHAHILYNVALNPELTLGSPVYWDAENGEFAPACARAAIDTLRGEYVTRPESNCIGLVYKKDTATTGSIVISGVVELPEITQLINTDTTGKFYLGVEPGSLTYSSLNVPICLGSVLGPLNSCSNTIYVYVNPEHMNTLGHTHISIPLQTVEAPSELIAGWRAAALDPNAPDGAIYYYNINADPTLAAVFPPIPVSAATASIDWAANDETIGGKEIPVTVPASIIKITNKGIYWMLAGSDPFGNSTVTPRVFRITLHYSRALYDTRKSMVTGLQPYGNHPFQFVNCEGEESTTGDLYAKFTLNNAYTDTVNCPGVAMQEYDESWNCTRTPVINGIYSTSSGVTITSDHSFSKNGGTKHAGLVRINVNPLRDDEEITPQILRLGSALEREYNGIPYVALPHGRESSVVGKMEIPGNIESENGILFKLRLLLIAPVTGTFPELSVELSRIPRPVMQPTSAVSLETPAPQITCITNIAVVGGTIFELESSEAIVYAGDTILASISRGTSNVTYPADAGIIRFNGIININ